MRERAPPVPAGRNRAAPVRRLALIVGIGGGALGAARLCAAQLSATLDAGLSLVRYDGFLSSTAASLTPQVRWERRGTHLSAHGTYLRFESGNTSLEGAVTAAWLAPLGGRWRGEVAASGGASEYADIASFWHGVAEGRLHFVRGNAGAWIGATGGRASFGAAARPVAVAAMGAWALRADMTWLASLDRSFVGDTAYSDVRASVRRRSGAVLLEASVGARFASRGGGRGIYGEGSATLDVNRSVALVLSGGRYPTDAISGSIAGRYLTGAIRIGGGTRRPPVQRPLPAFSAGTTAPLLEVIAAGDARVRLVISAPEATSVEVTGTFTDWQPVSLVQNANGRTWEIVLPLARGLHRIDVRINGGRWQAPAGTARVADDYGGEAGVFVVP